MQGKGQLPQNEASHTNCGWHVASGTVPVGCKLTVRPGQPYWECLVFYDQLVAKVSSQKDSKSDITSMKHCLVPGVNLRANRKGI